MIRVTSVNVGKPGPAVSKSGLSGIDKKPQAERVAVGRLGLAGDHIVDTDNHGGPDQAVYAYCVGDYDWWEAETARRFWPGAFGENLTLSGLLSEEVAVGDRLSCGGLVLEATSPRIPCDTFANHIGDKFFVKRFMQANRTGFYMRVISEGDVGVGDVFRRTPHAGERVTIRELVETYPHRRLDAATLARYRAAPVHGEMHRIFAELYD